MQRRDFLAAVVLAALVLAAPSTAMLLRTATAQELEPDEQPPAPMQEPARGTLLARAVRELPVGTHRPEILVTDRGQFLVVVVEIEGPPGVGQVKHKAYHFDASWQPIGKPFPVTRVTSEYGEPADHRATIVDGELVVTYQSLVWKDDQAPRTVAGPMETAAREQWLLLARFSLDGTERLRRPIARSTNFAEDNFPDHCLWWTGHKLLVGTGSMGEPTQPSKLLKIREVDLEANVLTTRVLPLSESGVPNSLGNSIAVVGEQRLLFSATDPNRSAAIAVVELGPELEPEQQTLLLDPSLEQNFPTGILLSGDYTFVGHIGRARGGPQAMEQNPYSPYLKVLDAQHRIIAETRVGEQGFAHVHPTLAQLGDRLFLAWSKQVEKDGRRTPQVNVAEFAFQIRTE